MIKRNGHATSPGAFRVPIPPTPLEPTREPSAPPTKPVVWLISCDGAIDDVTYSTQVRVKAQTARAAYDKASVILRGAFHQCSFTQLGPSDG